MNKLHESLGLTDGAGSVSSQRVISFMVVSAWLLTKVWASFKTGVPMDIQNPEVMFLTSVLGAGVLKNLAENTNLNLGAPKS